MGKEEDRNISTYRGKVKMFDFDIIPEDESSICWICDRVDCSWMDRFIPVRGWEAEIYDYILQTGTKVDSYIVKKCPLFLPFKNKNIFR